jgi:hypothetical protein
MPCNVDNNYNPDVILQHQKQDLCRHVRTLMKMMYPHPTNLNPNDYDNEYKATIAPSILLLLLLLLLPPPVTSIQPSL